MPKMKDSGIEWVGQIPDNWETIKIDNLYSVRNTKVSDFDYPPLSVTMQGIMPQLATAAKTNDHNNRKLVKKGDFAINSRSDRRGSCGISDLDGSVSLINTVLKPNRTMNSRYYNWLFHSSLFADEFYKWGHGIVDDLWTTNWLDMKKISVPYPDIRVQELIADFLDAKCSEIDALTADIEKQIETLEAYKKSVITEAVTKGLNPDVEMKDSGIEELGEIPTSWDIKRLKYAIDFSFKGNGITKEQVYKDGDTPCVRYGEIYFRYNISFNKCISYTKKDAISSKQYISYGDILCAGTGELIEEIGKSIVYLGRDNCLAGGDIIVLRHSQEPRYLSYFLNSEYAQIQRSKGKSKLKVVHISATDIGNIITLLPPKDEQRIIADTLDEKCAEIDSIIGSKKTQIDILTDYKKSLIYEYVTGKKEVQNE